MKSKWFALAPALVAGLAVFAFPAQAQAHDPYCAPQAQFYGGGYASDGDGYGRGYEHQGYDRSYEHSGYGEYGYSRQYQQRYQREYSQPYDGYGYGSRYGGATIHEDHIRTTFNPFPFPHIDKRVVHHEHPVY